MANTIDTHQGINIHEVAARGNEIYEHIKTRYEREKGKFLAIDIESKDVFLADSTVDAVLAAKSKYPDRVFYVLRIGYAATMRMPSVKILDNHPSW